MGIISHNHPQSTAATEKEQRVRDPVLVNRVPSGRGWIAKNAEMHKGEIRETGTHQDLLAQRGLYLRLYQLQFYQDYKRSFAESVADD